MFSVMQDQVI